MQVGQLTVTIRNNSGKGPARQLRAQGKVPGVCYGASTDGPIAPFPIVVDVKALKAALDPVRRQNTVISVTVEEDGKAVRTLSALLKEYQLHPLRRDVTHVDLLAIDPDREVVAVVPLEQVGKAAGAIAGGIIHTVMRTLEVRCKPADIPVKLTVDVSPLEIGDVLHVTDITLPQGVISVTGSREAVVSLQAPEVEKVTEAAAVDATAAAAAPAADAKGAGGKDAKAAPAAKPAKK